MLAKNTRLLVAISFSLALGGCGTLAGTRTVGPKVESGPARIAVVIDGARSAKVREAMQALLGEHYQVVSTTAYREAAQKLGARRMKARHVAKVAAELDVDAVLHARVLRNNKKRYRLAIHLRDAQTGRIVERFGGKLGGPRLEPADREFLASELIPAIDKMVPEMVRTEHASTTQPATAAASADENAADRKAKKAAHEKAAAEKAAREKAAHEKATAKRAAHEKAVAKKAVAKKAAAKKVAAKKATKVAAKRATDDDLDNVRAYVEHVDNDGQVIDDDMPSGFARR